MTQQKCHCREAASPANVYKSSSLKMVPKAHINLLYATCMFSVCPTSIQTCAQIMCLCVYKGNKRIKYLTLGDTSSETTGGRYRPSPHHLEEVVLGPLLFSIYTKSMCTCDSLPQIRLSSGLNSRTTQIKERGKSSENHLRSSNMSCSAKWHILFTRTDTLHDQKCGHLLDEH